MSVSIGDLTTVTDQLGGYAVVNVPVGYRRALFQKDGYHTVERSVTVDPDSDVVLLNPVFLNERGALYRYTHA